MNYYWTRDPATNQPVIQGDDGLVSLKDADGSIHRFAVNQVGPMLTSPSSTFAPASPADIDAWHKQNAATQVAQTQQQQQDRQEQVWNQATLDQKIQSGADTLASSIADGVTAIPRLVGEGVALGAHALGVGSGVSPLEALSGRNLLAAAKTGIDQVIGTTPAETAERQQSDRELTEGMPAVMRTALEVGGFISGGYLAGGMAGTVEAGAKAIGLSEEAAAALGKAAEAFTPEGATKVIGKAGQALMGTPAIGPATAAATRVGRYLGGATEGAAVGLTQASDESWIKDDKLTAESIAAQMGIGGLLGVAPLAGWDALKAIPGATSDLATKVFGRSKSTESLLDGPATDQAVNDMAKDVAGVDPPTNFAPKMKQALDWARETVEAGQSLTTGVDKTALQKYGALHFDPEAIKGQDLWRYRDQINEAGTKDLTEALTDLQEISRPIYDQVSSLELKKGHVEHLITGDSGTIMRLAHEKITEFTNTIDQLDKTTGRGETLYGEGKQVADMKSAYWKAIDDLDIAHTPSDVAMTLDGLKRRLQNVKVNAESSAFRLTSGLEIEQARARAKLADSAQERLRLLLEDARIWGNFGDSQKASNIQWNRMLATDQYVHPKISEYTGKISTPDRFGQPQWEISPARIASYVDGLGTAKSQLLDGKLRENILARRDLAQTLVDSYDLTGHVGQLHDTVGAADRALKVLDRLHETSGTANLIDGVMNAEAQTKGAGVTGTLLAGSLGTAIGGPIGGAVGTAAAQLFTSPGTAIRQAIALRSLVQRMTGKIGRHVSEIVTGGEEGAAAAAEAAGEPGIAGISRVEKEVAEEAEEFTGTRKFAEENVKENAKAIVQANQKKEQLSPAEQVAAVTSANIAARQERSRKYDQVTARVTALMSDPEGLANALASQTHEILHNNVQSSMVQTSLAGVQFLASKIPAPIFGASALTPQQLSGVSDADKTKFLRYFGAVNKPMDVFKDLRRGTATPEQMETLRTVYPQIYATAQMAVMKAVHNRKKALPLQTRLTLAELFDNPGQIEPTLDPAFMSRISQAFAQGQAGENAPSAPRSKTIKSNVADSMQSPLNRLSMH